MPTSSRSHAATTVPRPRRAAVRLTVLFGLAVLGLLATAVTPADAAPVRRAASPAAVQVDAAQPGTDISPSDVPVEELRLACAPDVVGDQRGVLCRWSATTMHRARGYQLYRSVDGSARQLLTTVGADGRLAYFDTDVTAPSHLVYGVVARNHAGRVVGIGGPARVQLGDAIEDLRLACAPDSVGDRRGVLCRWSATSRPTARGYLLYRAVASDEREIVARVGLDGRRAHFDTDVTPGAVHIYYVVAVDGDGNPVATGGPVRVLWPAPPAGD